MVFKREGQGAGTRAGAARSRCRRGPCSSPPARRRTSPTRRSARAPSSSTRRRSSSSRTERRRTATAGSTSTPDPDGFFTSYDARRHGSSPTTATTTRATPATSSRRWRRRRTATRTSSKLFARELAALDPARQADRDAAWARLVARLDDELVAVVEDVVRLTPTIVEVIVKAPAAARHFQPGQFYRLQNFESVRAARGRRRRC